VTADESRHDGSPSEADDLDLPPPTPFDRPSAPTVSTGTGVGPAVVPTGVRTVRRSRAALLVGLAAAVGFLAGLAAPGSVSLPGGLLPDASVAAAERDAGLVTLLELITRTEGEMLAFNDGVGERIREAAGEEEALEAIAAAAAEAADSLAALRPAVVDQTGHPAIDDMRTAYLPHLDSWIDYLAAIAEQPRLLFAVEEQQPFLLLINATAADFSDALMALLASEPAQEVVDLAERILDEGFRGMGDDPQV